MKAIRCPHCLHDHNPAGLEFNRDASLNILCGKCNNVMFGVIEEADEKVARLYRKPTHTHTHTPTHGPFQQHQQHSHHGIM